MQIFGADKGTFVEATKYVDANCDCDIIDINMGCPVPKVTKNEAGARLLFEPDKIYDDCRKYSLMYVKSLLR